jgi:anti-sigma regulatory factor (Ser/Thr protein kinase)
MPSTSIDIDIDQDMRLGAPAQGVLASSAKTQPPLPRPPADAQSIPIMPAGLASLRAAVARRAHRAGLTPKRREDIVLAVNELATNSIRHGGGAGTLTMWETPEALVCQVTDAGRLADPLAGRTLPKPGEVGHYGLWLVNRMCDLVEQRTLPRGNLVRVSIARG